MKRFTHLTPEDRYYIWALLKTGACQSEIAREIGCHRSTISREPGRDLGGNGYRAKQAQRLSCERRKASSAPWKMVGELLEVIENHLHKKWSPE